MAKYKEIPEEKMFVTLDLDDGPVKCEVITIFSVNNADYIAVIPIGEDGKYLDEDAWIYGYSENPDDPNEEPVLRYLEDDDEYDIVADAFDEYLDDIDFDEM